MAINPNELFHVVQQQPQESPQIAPKQLSPLMELMPIKGLDTWRDPIQMQANYLTDIGNMELDTLLSAIANTPGRVDLATGFSTPLGLDVFYPVTNQPYLFLASVSGGAGIWTQIDYIGSTAPVQVSFPAGAIWDPTAQTYFATLNRIFMGANGISRPLKIVDGWNTAAPAAQFVGIAAPGAAPTVALASGGGVLNGTYYYRVTFQNTSAFGPESSPGPVSSAITATNQAVTLTNIPTSTDPQVTARNIYRLGGSIPEWRLVGIINDNTTTTATDNVSDLSLGQLMVLDRGLPPAGMTVLIQHKLRLFGFVGNTLYFTLYNEPESWPATYALPVGDAEPIVTLGSTGSYLFIFKKNEAWVLAGESLADFVLLKVMDVGCVGPRAVCSSEGELFWLANDGLRATMVQTAGRPAVRLVGTPVWFTIANLPASVKKTAVLTYGNGKILVGFPDANVSLSASNPPGPFMLVFDTKVGDWERERNPIMSLYGFPKMGEWEKSNYAPRQMVSLFAGGDPGFFAWTEYTSAPTFNVRTWPASTYTDLGGPTQFYFERKQFGGLRGKIIARYREAEIIAAAQPVTLTLTLTVDDDPVNKQFTTTFSLATGPVRIGLPDNMLGKYITVNISGSATQQVVISGVRIWGWIEHEYQEET